MIDKVTLAITLPINGTSYDRQAALVEAITAASMRGDSLGAFALGQLLNDTRAAPRLVLQSSSVDELRQFLGLMP